MDEKHIAEIQQTLAMIHQYLDNRALARVSPEHQVVEMLVQRVESALTLLEPEVKKQ
jgi:hypothetical protein